MDSSRFSTVREAESSPVKLGHADRLNLALLMEAAAEVVATDVVCRVCGEFVPSWKPRSVSIGAPNSKGVPIIPACDRCADDPDWQDRADASYWPRDVVPIGRASTDVLLALRASMAAKFGPPSV